MPAEYARAAPLPAHLGTHTKPMATVTAAPETAARTETCGRPAAMSSGFTHNRSIHGTMLHPIHRKIVPALENDAPNSVSMSIGTITNDDSPSTRPAAPS